MQQALFWIVPAASIVALLLAWYFYRQMLRESEGTDTMQKIARYVRQGAMSYLRQQYKVVGLVFLGLVILFSVMAYGFSQSITGKITNDTIEFDDVTLKKGVTSIDVDSLFSYGQ